MKRALVLTALLAACSSNVPAEGVSVAQLSAAECAAAKEWAENVSYSTGAAVRHKGKIYQCVQGHTSLSVWPPDAVPALWRETDCATAPEPKPDPKPDPTPDPRPDPGGPSGLPSSKLFVGYYQTWSDTWKASGADTVLAKLPPYLNVVNLSFMMPDTTYVKGSLNLRGTTFIDVPYDGPTLKDAIATLHKRQPNTRVLIAVGGATLYNWAKFNARGVADLVEDFGLDGVDIDYEPATPNCTSAGGRVSCPTDAEYIRVVKEMRAVMPRPKILSIAGFHVGAYGEGQWATAKPMGSSYTGISLALFKSDAAQALDLVNVMSYDAGPTFDPIESMRAHQHYFKGKIAMGIEVPPEAWGGHVYTVPEIQAVADAVNASGAAGLMLWSIQKQGPAQEFATVMCQKLGLPSCNEAMVR